MSDMDISISENGEFLLTLIEGFLKEKRYSKPFSDNQVSEIIEYLEKRFHFHLDNLLRSKLSFFINNLLNTYK